MTQYCFTPPPIPAVPIRGSKQMYPIRRIFCVGRNYEAHAREMGTTVDHEAPFYFCKTPSAYVPSGATVPYPPGTSNNHYEMELVVALGAPAFRVVAEVALAAVLGYACGLDMTRRDLQNAAKDKARPWDLGKDYENSAVLSEIVPVSQCSHVRRGAIELRLNGALKQSSDVCLMIHPVAAIIADLSKYYHLQAGDLIYTGTPQGVGPVKPGDKLAGSVEGVGTIELTMGPAE